MKPVLLDTGVVVALLDRSEKFHDRCVAAVADLEAPLATCEAVIAESCYLLHNLPGAAEAILENVAKGIFQVPFQISRSAAAVQRLIRKYRDVPIDFADACLIHIADELSTGEILTLDSDFYIYRWGRNKPFQPLLSLG
ncbi:MAG: PIN domain-containing protein [Bryobacteraceae bacterium]